MNQNHDLLLSAKQLTCVRSDRQLFHDISFNLNTSEILQVCGENGSGKSSLLRIVAGLLQAEEGSVSFFADKFYLGHQLGLKPSFTVKQNLLFDLRYPKPSMDIVRAVLSDLDLLSYIDVVTRELSQGQQQRLALSKCKLSNAKLWILDEPFSSLDKKSVQHWKCYFESHVKKGGGILMSSHLSFNFSGIHHRVMDLSQC